MADYTSLKEPIQTVEGWKPFLSRWSEKWLSTDKRFSATVRKNCWLGYSPASEKEVEKLEKRLGYNLPPSFRSFLLTTNGWRRTSLFIQKIRSCSKIEMLKIEDDDFISIYGECEEFAERYGGLSKEEYFSYTAQASEYFDMEHLKASIVIADPVAGDSAIYLLNPVVVTADGEWEAWFSAHWIPGFVRYPSFSHLMVEEYNSFCHIELKQDSKDINGPYTGVYAPDQPRHESVRIGPGRKPPRKLTIEELVEKLNDPSPKIRKSTANKLIRKFRPHDPDNEHPMLVEPLSNILHSNLETDVGSAAALTLGSYGNESAIEPLVLALQDSDVASSAVNALFYLNLYYKSSIIADGLCDFLSTKRDYSDTIHVISILEDYQDLRLETITLRILDEEYEDRVYFIAAFALAKISEHAADELMARLKHTKPKIREVAAAALRETKERHCIPALKEALDDEDANVRMQAETSLRFLED